MREFLNLRFLQHLFTLSTRDGVPFLGFYLRRQVLYPTFEADISTVSLCSMTQLWESVDWDFDEAGSTFSASEFDFGLLLRWLFGNGVFFLSPTLW